ncbi:MAG: O-antigen ligase family protein [Clostridiales bacterium]|nr:O-antigen ligase family protein [Clostridiales bacterium]
MESDTQERQRRINMAVLACLTVIFVLAVMLQWYSGDRGTAIMGNIVFPLVCAGIGIVFARGAFAKYGELRLAAAFVLWYAVTRMIHRDHYLGAVRADLALLAGCCCLVLAHPYVMDAQTRRRVSRFVMDTLLVFTVAISWLAVYAAVTGNAVRLPLAQSDIGVDKAYRRLMIFGWHANTGGSILSVCAVMALYRHQMVRHKVPSAILTGFALLGYFCAVTLSDSRAAIINLAFFLSVALVILLSRRVSLRSRVLKGAALVLLAAVLCGSLYAANGLVRTSITALSEQMAPKSSQDAQEPQATQIAGRNLLKDASTLNGRTGIYRAAIRTLARDPVRLLTGGDEAVLIAQVNRQLKIPVDHTHNSFLQITAAMGLPGLAIVIAFLVLLILRGVRLFIAPSAASADRIALLIPVMIVIHGMVEPLVFYCFNLINVLFFLFSGIIFLRSREVAPARGMRPGASA